MRVKPEQLASHLKRGLAPVYLVSGDEPLQSEEAQEAIRAAARDQGFEERIVLQADQRFDWSLLAQYADSPSLFAHKRLFDVRMPGGKPGHAGAEVLMRYAQRPSPTDVLLLSMGKLDSSARNSAWYKALERAGAVIQVWPVETARLPAWITQRARTVGLNLSSEAAALLGERVEGNLLACAQEIRKLSLLYGETAVDVKTLVAAVADSARYDVFDLVETALQGEVARTLRILDGLRSEGVEATLVVWALTREMRTLAGMAHDLGRGMDIQEVLRKHRVWDRRKGRVGLALRRHRADAWLQMLSSAARVDRVIKGRLPGDPWEELKGLALAMCGVKVLRPSYV